MLVLPTCVIPPRESGIRNCTMKYSFIVLAVAYYYMCSEYGRKENAQMIVSEGKHAIQAARRPSVISISSVRNSSSTPSEFEMRKGESSSRVERGHLFREAFGRKKGRGKRVL